MNNSITDEEAAQNLQQVKSTQAEITNRGAKEHAPWIGWGLYVIVFYSLFDFVKPEIAIPITWIAALAGTFITANYFRSRRAKVKTHTNAPWFAWILYGLWIAAGAFLAGHLEPYFTYTWTVTGLVVGIPFVAYGLKLKSQA